MTWYEQFNTRLEELLPKGRYRRIKCQGFMDLVIEKIGDNCYSLAHYGEQNGDLMADPEVVFAVTTWPDGRKFAEPTYIKHAYFGAESWVYFDESQNPTYRADQARYVRAKEKKDLKNFARQWFSNLKQQGFFDVTENLTLEA